MQENELNIPKEPGVAVISQAGITDGNFDKKEVFEKEIRPLLQGITNICVEHGIPAILSVNFTANEQMRENCFISCLPGARTPDEYRVVSDILSDKSGKLSALSAIIAAYAHANGTVENN